MCIDWICVLNDRKLSLSDPIKLFVTDSIPSADGSTKTVPYLKVTSFFLSFFRLATYLTYASHK